MSKKVLNIENGTLVRFPQNLNRLILSQDIENLAPNIFANCKYLQAIIVDKRNKHYKSIDGVLYSKDGKELICYPQAKEDKKFNIPQGVRIISESAFENCNHLSYISFPHTVEMILNSAFFGCNNITRLSVPRNVRIISDYAFATCRRLKNVHININTLVSDCAFEYCNATVNRI